MTTLCVRKWREHERSVRRNIGQNAGVFPDVCAWSSLYGFILFHTVGYKTLLAGVLGINAWDHFFPRKHLKIHNNGMSSACRSSCVVHMGRITSVTFCLLLSQFEPVAGDLSSERTRSRELAAKIAKRDPLDVQKVLYETQLCLFCWSGIIAFCLRETWLYSNTNFRLEISGEVKSFNFSSFNVLMTLTWHKFCWPFQAVSQHVTETQKRYVKENRGKTVTDLLHDIFAIEKVQKRENH